MKSIKIIITKKIKKLLDKPFRLLYTNTCKENHFTEEPFMNDNNSKEVRNDKLQEILELSLLYDFYGELLGDHKKQIFEDYILNDLSLSEIADEAGISRQGVYDIVKRCSKKLKEYEEKLCLVKKFQTTKDKINQIKEISELIRVTNDVKRVIEIEQISEEILNDL